MVQAKICSPTCRSFKCAKDFSISRSGSVWCRLTEEICCIGKCTYALCIKRRLLPNGICGETVKRKTVEKEPEEIDYKSVRLRGKALRKIGERELF